MSVIENKYTNCFADSLNRIFICSQIMVSCSPDQRCIFFQFGFFNFNLNISPIGFDK
jgi:hypothetical protein